MIVAPHPLLDAYAFRTSFSGPLESGFFGLHLDVLCEKSPGLPQPENLREAVRALLRHGGFKPSGRNKPASEYVQNAVSEGRLGPINPAVDACNAASFHSGLPISVVDADLLHPPLRIDLASEGARYVFNASGQEIDLGGLLCLFDAEGPCANAVKDSQRTKTGPTTRNTLTLIWGTTALPGRAAAIGRWYRDCLHAAGATTERL